MAGHYTEQLSVQLSPKLAKDVRDAAKVEDLTVSEWIRWALRQKLSRS